MPNLIDDLGVHYVHQMYLGAWFLHNNTPTMLEAVGERTVTGLMWDGKKLTHAKIPHEEFPDMAKFAWPAMGYRNISFKKHNIVMDFQHARSAKRGLRDGLLILESSPVTQLFTSKFGGNKDIVGGAEQSMYAVLKPTYYTMQQAKQMLNDGEAVGVAISHSVAIELNPFTNKAEDAYSVLFKGAKVGTMSSDGAIRVPGRLAGRVV